MPLTHFLTDAGEPISFEAAIDASLETPGVFTAPMLMAMVPDDSRQHAGLSASMLGGCARKAFFELTVDYGQHPSKLWAALRGTAFHTIFEGQQHPAIRAEQRVARQTETGVWISGKADHLEFMSGRLYDYKSKEKFPSEVAYSYEVQLNTYAWLLADPHDAATHAALPPVTVTELYLKYFTMKEIGPSVPVRRWQPGEWEERMLPVIEEITGAIAGGPWPQREYPYPLRSPFCAGYCPFIQTCCERS